MPDEAPPEQPEPAAPDPFFHIERGGDFNACIGRQGSQENYMDGYIEAAQELVAAVIDKRQFGKRDTLAMPILYNARHAIELSLKFAIEHLHRLGRLKDTHRADHDIKGQYRLLSGANVGDEAAHQTIARLRPFVASLTAIDEDGQELRYARNRDGEKSMEAYALVDLEVVRRSLEDLAGLLSALKYRVIDLHEEKASGLWTAECSRSDLLSIAKQLPPRDEWITEAFTAAKAKVMERFGLSGKKFSAALKSIEASREGRRLIGLETPLAHLRDEHAMLVVEAWAERHPARTVSEGDDFGIVRPSRRDWEGMRERRQLANDLNRRVIDALAPEELADLETIFYIGRERWFPEFYDETLARTLREHALEKDPRIKLNHLMEKLNLADELQRGLFRLGRPSLAAKIADFLKTRA